MPLAAGGFVVAEGDSWSGRAGALRRFAQRRIFPRDVAGARWGLGGGVFQGGFVGFFGAARMFTASLAVAKSPPSRSWAGLRGGGRSEGAEAVASLLVRLGEQGGSRGADKQAFGASALSGRLCRLRQAGWRQSLRSLSAWGSRAVREGRIGRCLVFQRLVVAYAAFAAGGRFAPCTSGGRTMMVRGGGSARFARCSPEGARCFDKRSHGGQGRPRVLRISLRRVRGAW